MDRGMVSAENIAWLNDTERRYVICHKAACVPGSQPRPGSIIARSTAHRPETRRNRAHFAARTRRNFLSIGQQTERGKELWTYTKQNFAKIAEDIGALGIRVEKPAEIGPALQQALKADRPVVIDVVSDIDALAPVAVRGKDRFSR
jgi:hypothetical protein